MSGRIRTSQKNLMEESHRISLVISTVIILFIQILSISVFSLVMVRDLNHKAEISANEMETILREPLYNVDDKQVVRIGEALLSSGKISSMRIESTATGLLLDKTIAKESLLIHPQTRVIEFQNIDLGSVSIRSSDSDLLDIITTIFFFMVIIIGAVLGANFLANKFLVQKKNREVLNHLKARIAAIALDRYENKIELTGYSDMDAIIVAMNDMSRTISANKAALIEANNKLEQRVVERTQKLETALSEQQLLQERLVESGRLSALGQLSAGIAHELNTPLGAILSSNRTLIEYLDGRSVSLKSFYLSLDLKERKLHDAVVGLGIRENRTLDMPLPSRKIHHEIMQQLEAAGVSESDELSEQFMDMGLASCVSELIPFLVTKRDLEIVTAASEHVIARRMGEIISDSARKAAGVVSALKSYLSPDAGEQGVPVDIPMEINHVLTLMHNMLKHGITVHAELEPVKVLGSADKLSQVWMNIIRNAVQAMEFNGDLTIRTELIDGMAKVSFVDSGPGIPDAIKNRIFEPFFTTKKKGDGMGLGLDLCRKIIETHQGKIEFESRPGRTAFIVSIPALSDSK
jgi:signal transduction histidine kinase